ncbi:substrate-binding domain-containing protein [Pseudomonas sp. UBA2684]|uniref:substrate-binding domain-containing protein n=1 Tax=Pseudomonas sp. UBA2684 TaxID=1947311 RepID=UPI000E9AF74E|nr:substrate-binding domain-containing protein [Pseudomonas sp. UBA2684]HBX57180.1 LacI family transcriptional regulator [Pseudomonas sp.]|tara:strand:+ start:14661 stop:15608 length:948 start_codon:yes stop_codon:yes gene_type:complete
MQPVTVVRWRRLVFAAFALLAGPSWAKECIGVVPASAHAFWTQVEAGALQAATETGVDIYFRGPSREGSIDAQLQLIDKIVERGCKALIIAPSGIEIIAKVRELKARGILTFYIDRDVGGADVQAVIATNNYKAGQLAGQHLGQVMGGKGRVGVIRMSPPVTSTSERQRGFAQAAKDAGLSIVFDRALGDDPELTFDALRDQLPHLDALFTPNGSTTRETHAALLRLNAAGQLRHIGFDGGQLLVDALKAGQLDALILQQPYAMGYQSVRLAQRALRDKRTEPQRRQVELDVLLLTRENLHKPEVKELLALPKRP